MSIIEQERAAFEWWASDEGESPRSVERAGECYKLAQIQSYWMAWQARAALQSQATEAFPCRIVEADFETDTVTLEMHGKYTVSSGQKYLCDAPMQSQDREDAERYRWLRSAGKETERIVEDMYECALSGEDLDAAIDRARRVEGERK